MFFQRFIQTYVSPTKIFDDIREARVGWWQPFVWASILFLIGGFLTIPAQHAVMMLNPKMTPEMAEKMGSVAYIQMIFAPAMVLIIGFVAAGISYPVVTMQSKEATFKKYFTLILFLNLIYALRYVIACVMIRMKGVDNISSPDDLKVSFSLRMLAPEASAVVKGLLSSIEFFSIWGLAIVVLGLKRIFNLRTGQAIACVIPLWILYAGLSIMGEVFGNFGG